MITNISYPVHASDYLDVSGYKGNGSVAGIVDNDNRILVNYDSCLTFKEAQVVALALNKSRDTSVLALVKGTAQKVRL